MLRVDDPHCQVVLHGNRVVEPQGASARAGVGRIGRPAAPENAGWLSCSDVETLPYWTSRDLNSSCSWVFRLERTTARPLNSTAAGYFTGTRTRTRSNGHGFWFDFTALDPYPAVQWTQDVRDDDWYGFHNFGGIPPGPRDARMFTACANP